MRMPCSSTLSFMPVLQAIEAEADSKQEIQDAYDGCLNPNSDSSSIASSFSRLDGDSRYVLQELSIACLQDCCVVSRPMLPPAQAAHCTRHCTFAAWCYWRLIFCLKSFLCASPLSHTQ
jgi:hypothetical protein